MYILILSLNSYLAIDELSVAKLRETSLIGLE